MKAVDFEKILNKNNLMLVKKDYLNDVHLSFKAKGLLTYLLSLPEKWDIHISELIQHSTDGEHSIYTAMHELIDNEYIKTEQKNVKGTFKNFQYKLTEKPLPENRRAVIENLLNNEPLPENRRAVKRHINKGFSEVSDINNEPLPENHQAGLEPLPENHRLVNKSSNKKETIKKDRKNALINIPSTHRSSKSGERSIEYSVMNKQLNFFIEQNISDDEIKVLLKQYYQQRKVKNLKPEGLKILLEDFKKYGGTKKQQIEYLRSAIAGGYLTIIPPWIKTNKNNFENSSDDKNSISYSEMTEEQKKKFEEKLLRDENGNLISF